jgi:hypothetical protein
MKISLVDWEKYNKTGGINESTRKLDHDLAGLVCDVGGHIALTEAYHRLIRQPRYRQVTVEEFLRMLGRVRYTVVELNNPDIPVVRLRRLNVWDSLLHPHGQNGKPGKIYSRSIELFGSENVFSEREAVGTR